MLLGDTHKLSGQNYSLEWWLNLCSPSQRRAWLNCNWWMTTALVSNCSILSSQVKEVSLCSTIFLTWGQTSKQLYKRIQAWDLSSYGNLMHHRHIGGCQCICAGRFDKPPLLMGSSMLTDVQSLEITPRAICGVCFSVLSAGSGFMSEALKGCSIMLMMHSMCHLMMS